MNEELFECLLEIQQTLKVEKLHDNSFGGFKYRSLPDIVLAAKPIANKHNCVIMTRDKLVHEGNHFYILAEAAILHKSGQEIVATALARETEERQKFDGAQLTGAASSYARKYAYNGLFAIDDSKDTDEMNNSLAYTKPSPVYNPAPPTIKEKSDETKLISEMSKKASECKTLDELQTLYQSDKSICQNQAWISIVNANIERLRKDAAK